MTIREAYEILVEAQRGYLCDSEEDEAISTFINEFDRLIIQISDLGVELSRAKKKCTDKRRLKRKYFERLKAIKTDKERFIQLLNEIGIKYELGSDTIYIDKFACDGAEEFGISFWDGEDYPEGSFHEFWVVPENYVSVKKTNNRGAVEGDK